MNRWAVEVNVVLIRIYIVRLIVVIIWHFNRFNWRFNTNFQFFYKTFSTMGASIILKILRYNHVRQNIKIKKTYSRCILKPYITTMTVKFLLWLVLHSGFCHWLYDYIIILIILQSLIIFICNYLTIVFHTTTSTSSMNESYLIHYNRCLFSLLIRQILNTRDKYIHVDFANEQFSYVI